MTVCHFSEHVVPDFLDLHAQVMPCLINVLKELNPTHDLTIQKSLSALKEFTDNLNQDVKLYLNDSI